MRGHADAEALAAYREGLLSRRKARQVAAHLAHCAQCAGLDAQLAELPALLARSPAPPMPAALTARIEAAIAAEAAARSETTDVAAAAASLTRDAARVTRDAAPTRGHRKPRAPGRSRLVLRAAAAAAAVVVIGGAGYGLLRLLSGSAPYPSGTSAAAPAAQGAGASGARKAVSQGGPHAAMSPLNERAGLRIVTSGTNYQPAQLKAQVRATLARFALKAAGPVEAAPSVTPGPSAGLISLRACLRRVAGGRYVQLVDLAYYEGKPAAIIVIPGPGANEATVRVVATGCSATATDLIFSTLLPTGG